MRPRGIVKGSPKVLMRVSHVIAPTENSLYYLFKFNVEEKSVCFRVNQKEIAA